MAKRALERIKKGDTVVVLAGKNRGRKGQVLRVASKKDRVFVERVNMIKRHQKPTQTSPGGIIEKEAGFPSEMPDISLVFHNRLRLGMRLQCDPTAVYGIDGFRRRIRSQDLKRDTPYNTYRYGGLPPGPICNPGINALHAALWPADTKYLFFVSKGNGYHHFSRTLSEHREAIRGKTASRR